MKRHCCGCEGRTGCGTPAVPSERSLAPSSLPRSQEVPIFLFCFLVMSATPQIGGNSQSKYIYIYILIACVPNLWCRGTSEE